MPNTPFPDQILPPDHLTFVWSNVQTGKAVAGGDLLLAIEQSMRLPIPENVRELVRRAVIPAETVRGRPSKFCAALYVAREGRSAIFLMAIKWVKTAKPFKA